jgi:SAM-dependent methyltransferase
VVDRAEHLLRLARNRRVIHLGFVDEGRMDSKRSRGTWLHDELSEAATELVGIDLNKRGVQHARDLGLDAFVADCQKAEEIAKLDLAPAEVVLAGELIEHLDRPGAFLEAVKYLVKPGGVLVITTPNAARLTNFLGSLTGRELVNADHVGWYSWHVLQTLLVRHGWAPERFLFYAIPASAPPAELAVADRLRLRAVDALRLGMHPLFRLRPALSDGIIVEASLASSRTEGFAELEGRVTAIEKDGLEAIAP